MGNERRTLEAGKSADILVVDGSQLDDIQALEKIRHVMCEGKPVLKNTHNLLFNVL